MTRPAPAAGLFRAVDCVQLPVPDLDGGLAFHRDRLGHQPVWRTETAAGLRLGVSDTELVLQTQRPQPEVDFLAAVQLEEDRKAAGWRRGHAVDQPSLHAGMRFFQVQSGPGGMSFAAAP